MFNLTGSSMTMVGGNDENLPAGLTAQLFLRRTGNWARWLRRHWSEVAIVDAVWSIESITGRPRLHAQVCVTLGHVLPADIRVELLPAQPLPAAHRLAHGRAMFSVTTRNNGSQWFAVNAPATPEDAEREWIVRISPSHAKAVPEIAAIERKLEVVPSGTSRHDIRPRHTA
jgi:hypothetical protein